MYQLKYDNSKNRVYVTVTGSLKLEEIDAYIKDYKAIIDKTTPGFTVCVDNLNAALNTPEVSARLVETKDYSIKKGMRNAAMVVSSSIFKMQMKRLFDEFGNVYETVDAADKFLDSTK